MKRRVERSRSLLILQPTGTVKFHRGSFFALPASSCGYGIARGWRPTVRNRGGVRCQLHVAVTDTYLFKVDILDQTTCSYTVERCYSNRNCLEEENNERREIACDHHCLTFDKHLAILGRKIWSEG